VAKKSRKSKKNRVDEPGIAERWLIVVDADNNVFLVDYLTLARFRKDLTGTRVQVSQIRSFIDSLDASMKAKAATVFSQVIVKAGP
jgi:hypothetical protein